MTRNQVLEELRVTQKAILRLSKECLNERKRIVVCNQEGKSVLSGRACKKREKKYQD